MPLQVFISYAHHDDLAALDNAAPGFVSTLWTHLEYHFKRLGPPAPFIWRDDNAIRPSDEFGPVIQAGIEASDILLVVLSNNWLSRPYCQMELELFVKKWRMREGPAAVSQRIVPVVKSPVPYDQWPPGLKGKQGFVFFDEDETGPRRRREFFDYTCGKPLEEYKRQYHARIDQLATELHQRAAQPGSTVDKKPPASQRTVYVAQPAADMREAYDQVVTELKRRDFAVVPDAQTKIPLDSVELADAFVDAALASAEASIHLLGRLPGQAPDGEDAEPIVKLQLSRAALRAAKPAGDAARGFYRFIWAPKFIGVQPESPAEEEGRNSDKVLEKFGQPLPGDHDKVEGCECNGFIEMMLGYLDRNKPEQQAGERLGAASRFYLHCREDDVQYALQVGKALQLRNIQPVKPMFRGDPNEVAAQNKSRMASCDAVVLCWGNAPETWVALQPGLWSDYRSLGREKDFARRGLLAGPPGDDPDKEWNVSMQRYDGVDLVLDLRQYDSVPVPPEALDPLFEPGKDAAAEQPA